jgi:hypothetical protein
LQQSRISPVADEESISPTSGTRSVRAIATLARYCVILPAIIGVSLLTTGCLYWARVAVAGWPGPRVADALPLDELPGHDSVPLVVYVFFALIAGVVLGMVARWAGLNRLTAGLALAVGTGVWTFALEAISLFIVRQVAFSQAAATAATVQPVYLSAVLVGGCGVLLGRMRRGRPSRPRRSRRNRVDDGDLFLPPSDRRPDVNAALESDPN